MQIEVKNYRGVSDAALTLAPIALVAGMNHSGKSSIAQAVAAAVTQNAAPIDGIAKNAAGMLLRDGQKRGRCVVGDDTGNATANWPGASVSTEGNAPWASDIAAGIISLVNMKQKDAAALLISAMEAMPTLDDLKAALPDIGEDMVKAIWDVIQADGWDAAHKRSQERGAKMKGAWEHVTGERYGTAKGAEWQSAFLNELPDGVELDNLEDDEATTKDALETAIAGQGAAQAEIDRLSEKAAAGLKAGETLVDAEAQLAELQGAQDAIATALNALPRPENGESYVECPHCKGHLVIVSRTEVRPPSTGISDEENAARVEAITAKTNDYEKARQATSQLSQEIGVLRRQQQDGSTAANQLAAMPRGTVTADDVAKARAEHETAAEQVVKCKAAIKAEDDAAKLHDQIIANMAILDQLAPNGLRQQVLADKMAEFNGMLARLCTVAGWPAVKIADDLSTTLGDRPYLLLSESEKYRVRTILQVAIADLDGSDVMIVDAADILDRNGRNGLFKLLHHTGMLSLVCMTLNKVEDVPNLAAAGFGASYWLNESVLSQISA
jgi:hypothetical protein